MLRIAALASACVLCAGVVLASSQPVPDQTAREKSFDAMIQPSEMGAWLKLLAAEPNHVGSPHDKANAEWVLAQFKSFGWDAHIETFQVLYPTPISETLELMGAKPYKATLQEPPIPGDTSATAKQPPLPAYVEYQGDGDVKAPLVYVNYGMQDDYKALERMGVSVKGKIVIARYGKGWRGLKPKLAQDHGAIGCLIYSDPADDGYAEDIVYPTGAERPPHGFQRGSVFDMPLYPGDPLTPGVGATADAKRLTRAQAAVILKIPVLPISYADAQVFLQTMTGNVVPGNWRGALPITYRVGPSNAAIHLAVKSDWSMKTLYDVIATLRGVTYPDQWVVRGNHRDGWVFGATDPLSGQIAMLEEAKALGQLEKQGWRPKRTIVYASWDGEEPGLLGSTEWAETHGTELKQKAVLYINSDSNARGFLSVGGSHDLEHFINQVASDVIDPETKVTVGERHRAKVRIDALAPDVKDEDKEKAKTAANPAKDFPLDALGSGSDYSTFIEHLGVPAMNIGYDGEGESDGVYHSRYDTYEHHSRFVDPGFVYSGVLAKTVGRMVLRLADTELPVERAQNFSDTMTSYLGQVKKLEGDKRKEAETQKGLLKDRAFQLAADPTKTSGVPTALNDVPKLNLAPLEKSIAHLTQSAKAYDTAFAAKSATLAPSARAKLWDAMQRLDQRLTSDVGLPGRPWYRNLIYAPGRFTGYGAKTLPGVREAIEDQRWSDAEKYAKLTADVLDAYSNGLDQATKILNGK
ncbi:MAG: M28 family peptidase [Proteobacteria bacterium]|nr:M28 family peptidase [Pseudomonadota bacterium]